MAESLTHDVLILGAGLAGLRAAVELSHRTEGHIDIGIVSKVQLMRAHSVCAEGGTAAVLREDEVGDSIGLHAWDSVKGSDFLADQDVVWRFCKAMPREIHLLDHWGIPWTRDAHGRISQRPFGGHSYPTELVPFRAALAEHFGEVQVMRGQANGRFRREGTMSFTVGDAYTLVSPVTVFDFPDDHKSPPRIDILGFTLIRLDPGYVTGTMLPALTARHFHGDDGAVAYRIAVTDRHDISKVIWESEAGAAAAMGASPDVDAAFMSARPDQVFMIARNPGATPPSPGPGSEERIVISVIHGFHSLGMMYQALFLYREKWMQYCISPLLQAQIQNHHMVM